jgi:putative phage-type endonuclease
MSEDFIQGTPEWHQARLGKVTASRIADICATIKNGDWGASRKNYAAQLVCERLTGTVTPGYVNAEMQWGTDHEAEAKMAYEWVKGEPVHNVGFIDHPTIAMSGASPDGYISVEGGVEIKCPNSATHIETLLGGSIPKRYILQCQWQMSCKPNQRWVDYCSYDPRLPASMRLYVQTINRDNSKIAELEKIVTTFLAEVDTMVSDLNKKFAA